MNKLVSAQATQYTTEENGTSVWYVVHKDENLWTLPSSLTPQEAMDIIHFGRKFEEQAYQNGIQFQKELVPKEITNLRQIVRNLKAENEILLKENERIGSKLDELLTSDL